MTWMTVGTKWRNGNSDNHHHHHHHHHHRMGSLVAMAVQAASDFPASPGLLVEYARAVLDRGMNPNDSYIGCSCAVSLAAYHGYLQLLHLLLVDVRVRIDNERGENDKHNEHAVLAAVRNGQHDALQMILRERLDDVKILLQRESDDTHNQGTHTTTLSDQDYRALARDAMTQRDRGHLGVVLKEIYPMHSIWNWSKTMHWTFPMSDRRILNWLWHASLHSSSTTNQGFLPPEVMLRIFSFVRRGWWIDVIWK
jgi:hypothetical protein